MRPQDAFFCVVGANVDGHEFADDVISRGASTIVCERPPYLTNTQGVTEVMVADTRRALAEAAAEFYGRPSQELSVVGVTGTNGKTTVTHLVEHIMNVAERPCGLIGTCGSRACGHPFESAHTTPESADLQRLFGLMRDEGAQAVALEVSSHALSLGRVAATDFAVTAFTNLTQDHLDYHSTFEEYFAVKKRLFSDEFPAVRVISVFGSYGRTLAQERLACGDEVITVGADEDCTIRLRSISYAGLRTRLHLDIEGAPFTVEHGLLGDYNTENVMVALGCALALGVPPGQAARSLMDAAAPAGRMERAVVAPAFPFSVYVDYAHTPDALGQAVSSAKRALARRAEGVGVEDRADGGCPVESALPEGRVLLVFGCEGDRDRGKRAPMAEASLAADVVFLTNDNAHGEGVLDVLAQVEKAYPETALAGQDAQVRIIPDRKAAIQAAVDEARAGDIVLICGRGHEGKMMFGSDTIQVDDREEARYALLMRAVAERREVR